MLFRWTHREEWRTRGHSPTPCTRQAFWVSCSVDGARASLLCCSSGMGKAPMGMPLQAPHLVWQRHSEPELLGLSRHIRRHPILCDALMVSFVSFTSPGGYECSVPISSHDEVAIHHWPGFCAGWRLSGFQGTLHIPLHQWFLVAQDSNGRFHREVSLCQDCTLEQATIQQVQFSPWLEAR